MSVGRSVGQSVGLSVCLSAPDVSLSSVKVKAFVLHLFLHFKQQVRKQKCPTLIFCLWFYVWNLKIAGVKQGN